MSTRKIAITINGQILSGTISQVKSKCGKEHCHCHSGKLSDLHGPYHRWSGYIDGRLSHRTLSEEVMRECEKRIANYHQIQEQVSKILKNDFQNAPWVNALKANKRK